MVNVKKNLDTMRNKKKNYIKSYYYNRDGTPSTVEKQYYWIL